MNDYYKNNVQVDVSHPPIITMIVEVKFPYLNFIRKILRKLFVISVRQVLDLKRKCLHDYLKDLNLQMRAN